jgi:hypothetical protein
MSSAICFRERRVSRGLSKRLANPALHEEMFFFDKFCPQHGHQEALVASSDRMVPGLPDLVTTRWTCVTITPFPFNTYERTTGFLSTLPEGRSFR